MGQNAFDTMNREGALHGNAGGHATHESGVFRCCNARLNRMVLCDPVLLQPASCFWVRILCKPRYEWST